MNLHNVINERSKVIVIQMKSKVSRQIKPACNPDNVLVGASRSVTLLYTPGLPVVIFKQSFVAFQQ